MAYFSNSHPTGSGICNNTLPVNVCLTHRTLGFVNGTNVKSVINKKLLLRTRQTKVTWSQVRATQCLFMTLLSKLLQQACHLSDCAGPRHQVNFIVLALWRSILVVTVAKLKNKCKLSHSNFIHNALNCVMKSHIHSQHTVTHAWTIMVIVQKVQNCSLVSREKLFWIKRCWISKYSLCTFTVQSTLIFLTVTVTQFIGVTVTTACALSKLLPFLVSVEPAKPSKSCPSFLAT